MNIEKINWNKIEFDFQNAMYLRKLTLDYTNPKEVVKWFKEQIDNQIKQIEC